MSKQGPRTWISPEPASSSIGPGCMSLFPKRGRALLPSPPFACYSWSSPGSDTYTLILSGVFKNLLEIPHLHFPAAGARPPPSTAPLEEGQKLEGEGWHCFPLEVVSWGGGKRLCAGTRLHRQPAVRPWLGYLISPGLPLLISNMRGLNRLDLQKFSSNSKNVCKSMSLFKCADSFRMAN